MRRTPRRGAGFSLLEIVIVVAILSILLGMAMPAIGVQMRQEKVEKTQKELDDLEDGVVRYFEDTWQFPVSLSQLETNQPAVAGWKGPYVTKSFTSGGGTNNDYRYDGWRNAYEVAATGTSTLRIRSGGPDETQGNADDITKVVNVVVERRDLTRDEIQVVGNAILRYYASNTTPLPMDVEKVVKTLYNLGYLPSKKPYEKDGWSNKYLPVAGALGQCVAFDSTWGGANP